MQCSVCTYTYWYVIGDYINTCRAVQYRIMHIIHVCAVEGVHYYQWMYSVHAVYHVFRCCAVQSTSEWQP